MIKAVLDTNCILSSISRKSPHRIIIDRFIEGKYTIAVSNSILSEYEEKISQIFDVETAEYFIGALLLSDHVIRTEIYYNLSLIYRDFDDNKFADCAFSSNAHYLVSNDKHLLVLKDITFPKINVITLNEFKSVLSQL